MPEERRTRRRRRGRSTSALRRWRQHLRWVWFYALAFALVTGATLCALKDK